MNALCAPNAHKSTTDCASYAHDRIVKAMHNAFMDTDWFKEMKRKAKVTDAVLAEALGVERSVANKVVNGKVEMNARRADAVADLFGVSRDEVLYRAGISTEQPTLASPGDGSETVDIQRLDLSVSMGHGTLIEGYVENEPVTFDLAFIRAITRAATKNLRLITGIGDSMYPTLNDGDTILIDTSDRRLSKLDGIYWVNVYGAANLKRLRAIGKGRVLIKSDNPAVDDQEVDAEDLLIEGRAIWVARGL